jgi:FMN-dependent NADH-azoreductase
MTLLRIDSSILGPYSSSRALADIVQKHWLEEHPTATVVTRDLAAEPVTAASWMAAVSAGRTPEDQRSAEQKAAVELAGRLHAELVEAETVIVATGLYNWGVNQLLKSWFDLAFTGVPQGEQPLAGKDVALVVTRGGYYGEDGPRAGWDHAIDWYVRVLSEVWGGEVTVVDRDFTLVGVNPALDEFTERGAALHAAARDKAEMAGRELAQSYAQRRSA